MGAIVASVFFVLLAAGTITAAVIMPSKKVMVDNPKYGQSTTREIRNYWKPSMAVASVIPLILAGAIFFFSGFHSVPTKSVGVVTSYGKVLNEYGPGSHWLFPTKSLNIVQDTIQSDSFLQANEPNCTPGNSCNDTYTNSGAVGYCITVRLGMQNEGCADVQLQTRTNASAVPVLYSDYSSYGPNLTQDVDKYVVKRDLVTVLNRDLGDYNVIQDITQQLEACDLKNIQTCVVNAQSQFSKFDPQLTSDLQRYLGDQVSVSGVNLQYIHYDSNTEAAIRKITNNYLETAAAIQQQQTNTALSQAAADLQNNKQALTPAYLQYLCYQTTQDAEKGNYQLPATWSCTGSGNSGVLVNGK